MQFELNPKKHSSWWRSIEDIFLKIYWKRRHKSTCWRRLKNVLKMSWKRFEDFLQRYFEDSSRSFEDVFGIRLANTSWRSLEDVLENEKLLRWRRLPDVLKTSWKTRNICWETCLEPKKKWLTISFILN